MKKVLCGLVIALMMTGGVNAGLIDQKKCKYLLSKSDRILSSAIMYSDYAAKEVDKIISKDVDNSKDLDYWQKVEMEQIKENDLIDTCASIECGNCYSMLDVNDYNIVLEVPNNLKALYAKEKIWARSKDFVEMSQGTTSMDWDYQMGGKSFEELAEAELKSQGVI